MTIERFKDRDAVPVYRRVRDAGIVFPEGLKYVGSWIEPNFDRCFQLMECDDLRLLQQWILECRGTGMTFEIVPVVPARKRERWSRPISTEPDRRDALPARLPDHPRNPPFLRGSVPGPPGRHRPRAHRSRAWRPCHACTSRAR